MKLLTDVVLIVGLVFVVLILVVLFKQERSELPQRLLRLIFFFFAVELLFFYGVLHDIDWLMVVLFPLEDPLAYIVGPLFYLYTKSLLVAEEKLLRQHWKHFIPALVYCLLITLPVMYYFLTDTLLFSYLRVIDEYSFLLNFHVLYIIGYVLLSLRLLNQHHTKARQHFSNLESHDLAWVKHLLIGVVLVCLLDGATTILELVHGVLNWETGLLTAISLVMLVMYLGYHGVTQSKVLLPSFLMEPEPMMGKVDRVDTAVEVPPSTTKIGLPDEEVALLSRQLQEQLKSERPYLDPELTLGKLAVLVNTTDKKLSTLLNQHLDTSFYDLINQHRVEAVKTMIESGEYTEYSLLGIGQEAGFKSKTSFYRIFKKEVGVSPAAYKKAHLIRIVP